MNNNVHYVKAGVCNGVNECKDKEDDDYCDDNDTGKNNKILLKFISY